MLYVLIHIHEGAVEAAFVFPDAKGAVSHGVVYARRSNFFLEDDECEECEEYATRQLADHSYLESDANVEEVLVIKRAYAVEGATVALKVGEPA